MSILKEEIEKLIKDERFNNFKILIKSSNIQDVEFAIECFKSDYPHIYEVLKREFRYESEFAIRAYFRDIRMFCLDYSDSQCSKEFAKIKEHYEIVKKLFI